MRLSNKIAIGAGLLLIVLLLELHTDFDVFLQNQFFDFASQTWFITPEMHKNLSFIFYKGAKNATIIIGILSLFVFAFSYKFANLQNYRKSALILFLSIIFVPIIVAGSKQITNVYCPKQLETYGGKYPFVRVLENYPSNFTQLKKGKCFPSGHSTVGFSLMALFFCFKNRKNRIIGLSIGIAMGWITGTYQMLRGEHFLSHTVFSMIASFTVILIINEVTTRIETYEKNRDKTNSSHQGRS